MILYIILEFVMITLSLIHLKVIFSKRETKLLTRCQNILMIMLFVLLIILYLKERQAGTMNWELQNFSMIGLCLYTGLISITIFIFYWYVVNKKKKITLI